jgi:hypothetical protein
MRSSSGVVLVVVLALAAAACGGGGKPLSAKDYSAKLNAICTDLNAKQKELGTPGTLPEFGDKGSKLISDFGDAIGKIEKLRPPAAMKAPAARFVALAEQERDGLEELFKAAKKNDAAGVRRIATRIAPLDRQMNRIANSSLNAPACGQPG